MEKEFVPYELAVKLKELGFDEPCFGTYCSKNFQLYEVSNAGDIKAPLYQQAFRWFREKYEIMSWISRHRFNITTSLGNKVYYRWVIEYETVTSEPHINSQIIYSSEEYDNYPEAELACLDKLIEIVESKQKEDGRNSIKDR